MQQLIQGEYTIIQAAEAIRKNGYQRVFIITGRHFIEENDLLFFNDLDVRHFLKQGPNVKDDEIARAIEAFEISDSEVMVAIGGGSVIDLAKAVIYKRTELSKPVPFFIAIPTTIGSGSEATHFAVVYNGMKKVSLVHESLLPELVILDPSLLASLPAYQAAVTGMDAVSQAIESYWNLNATKESQRYAMEVIEIWKDSFIDAVNDTVVEARTKMLEAAHLAGMAINITRTTGPHALSYYLTAYHGVAHGQAVALFLPIFFLYNDPKDIYPLLGVTDKIAAKDFIQQKMKDAGLATTLQQLGIDKAVVIDNLLNEVNEERFANNPVRFDREKLKTLINQNL